jgi:hypothetical protein
LDSQKNKKLLREASREAYLGAGKLNICSKECREQIALYHFNPGRQVDRGLLKTMMGAMKAGYCLNESSPLVVAIDRSAIDTASLAEEYSGKLSSLPAVQRIQKGATLFVLNGGHRVRAAHDVSTFMRKCVGAIGKQVGHDKDVSKKNKEDIDEDQDAFISAKETELEAMKEVVEQVETWPVHFYDTGASWSRGSCLGSTDPSSRETWDIVFGTASSAKDKGRWPSAPPVPRGEHGCRAGPKGPDGGANGNSHPALIFPWPGKSVEPPH